jgi:hypothetical protein
MAGANEKIKLAGSNREDIQSTSGALHVVQQGNVSDVLSEYLYVYGDESGMTYDYYGFEKPDGLWAIARLTKTMTEELYCAGSSNFTTAWTNKTSQTYGTPSEIF